VAPSVGNDPSRPNASNAMHPRQEARRSCVRARDFHGTWTRAFETANVPSLLFHDLHRTAARNFRRAGVAEGVIMKIAAEKRGACLSATPSYRSPTSGMR
jgi:hypothetical protein